MLPLTDWPEQERRRITGVCTDIDDTLTADGTITPEALQALHALRAAGLTVVAVTGRPIGWCEHIAARWPLAALVAENGAVALLPDRNGLQPLSSLNTALSKRYQDDAATRASARARLQQVAARVLREVPGAALARDSSGRETDIAFDVAEHQRLEPAQVQAIVERLQAEGLHVTRSSIHVHGAVHAHDKWSGAQWAVQALRGRPLAAELDQWVAVGDSGNDEALFRHFRHSVGVANIRRCADQLRHRPRYITRAERGAGFAEVAQALLQARQH
jgi:hypothetical protein